MNSMQRVVAAVIDKSKRKGSVYNRFFADKKGRGGNQETMERDLRSQFAKVAPAGSVDDFRPVHKTIDNSYCALYPPAYIDEFAETFVEGIPLW